jgi:hypothetical protein
MKSALFPTLRLWAFCLLLAGPDLVAADDSLVTAVFSNVSNGYTRKKNPDGTFQRETYALANGQYSPGAVRDPSISAVPFPTIAGLVAKRLAQQNYFLAQDAKSADLLLIISWGTTIPYNDAGRQANTSNVYTAMNNVNAANAAVRQADEQGEQQRTPDGIQTPDRSVRDAAKEELEGHLLETQTLDDVRMKANERNARLLGYATEINARNDNSRFAGGGSYFDDLIADIQAERYYLIVSAYDFRAATQEKKRKLLWATRVSIQTRGNRFDEGLVAMIENASKVFGQDSGRLIRQYQRGTRVDLGDLKVLGVVPGPPAEAKPDERK